ncbi:MAG: hypothetical protein ACRDO2_00260 [Nocardioidaceae bacterium]
MMRDRDRYGKARRRDWVETETESPHPDLGGFLLGMGLGLALFHSRFGFTSAWRQLVAVGQGKALRVHTLLLAATAIAFAPFLAAGVGPSGQAVEATSRRSG